MRWRFPNAFTDRGENYVVFLPDRDDGFAVRLAVKLQTDGPQKFVINYGILSAETGDRDQAIETFAFGLSTDRRIREYSFGGVPSYWVVDHWDYRMKRWREGLEFILWRRLRPWRKSRLRFLQNHLIDFEDSAASCAA